MKPNIGIDIDGVICDIYHDALRVGSEMYPTKMKMGESITGSFEDQFHLTEKEVMDLFIEVGKRGLLRNAKLYPGAKEVLYKIYKKYNIYFISWRNYIPNAREDTLYWLDSNKIPYERLIMTSSKYKVAIRENFCFFLDDDTQQCNRIAKTIVPTYLFCRPWNEKDEKDALVKSLTSWREVERILNF
jgi:uncharacterized HAD superfamily protein